MVLTRTDLEEIRKLINDSLDRQEFINRLAQSIEKKIEEKYNNKFLEIKKEMSSLNTKISALEKENSILKKSTEVMQQQSRALNVRIFGMEEQENENLSTTLTTFFKTTLRINPSKESDIKRCYRVAAKNPTRQKPRSILVEFADVNKRAEVLKNRSKLKNSGIFIQEDLTQYRVDLLSKAISKFSVKNAWSNHGNIYVKSSGIVRRVNTANDLSDE